MKEEGRYLAIQATFLDPRFHGIGDNGRPEWPPSPMRLFQALLAGSKAGRQDGRWDADVLNPIQAAYLWLERQEPPVILAPTATPGTPYTIAVPNNDGDEKPDPGDRITLKTIRPHRIETQDHDEGEHPAVTYLWPIPDNDQPAAREHATTMTNEAKRLYALGWGTDLAAGYGRILSDAEAGSIPGETWKPQANGSPRHGALLRVPKEGSLQALEDDHQSFLSRLDGPGYRPRPDFTKFNRIRYYKDNSIHHREYAAFEMPEGISFRQEAIITVAAMLRSLACRPENRQDFIEQFRDETEVYLAGHVTNETETRARFSYLPLPTIGHPHSDGMIRRMLIAEPSNGGGARARWAQSRLSGQTLRDKNQNERGLLLEASSRASRNMVQRYTEASSSWTSVTPVFLQGYDSGKHAKAERLMLRAIDQAGIPMDGITDLTIRKPPFWPRAQHPREYQMPSHLENSPGWHLALEFKEQISGPIAIGAGRYAGLGIMAADNRHETVPDRR